MATALITGGTSGIGKAFADELAQRGYDLVLVARDQDRLDIVAEELGNRYGVEIETLAADLAVREDTMRVAGRLEDPAAPVEMLVNNAGFGLHSTLLGDDVEVHAKALDVMCLAVLILGGAAGRAMKKQGSGQIINVSSTSGAIFTGNYSAVKAWCTTYSQSLALELKGTGVTVTALQPGWVRTEFHDRAGIKANNLPGFVWIDKDFLVRECLADANQGKYVSVPSWKWKLAMFVANHGPKSLLRWFSTVLTNSRKTR